MTSRTGGGSHVIVADDTITADAVSRLECPDKSLDRPQLSGSRNGFVKVADQRDPDAELIVFPHTGMSSLYLLPPAESRFDLPVTHTMPIPDDKVVANSQPVMTSLVFPFAVSRIDSRDAPL